ncbi:MAG: glycosyltransferase family 4 protein [Candidatus Eisenbacteria bacterium]|uniref:Glycosyltransferase family 4 protein n=1 Tax=Eiseniibacteriota bacterium TaxID=2212470 RepID=A0A956N8R1_UNCEI|nr:glycosyltransferase family 4 protein [Candidatus Eisenbacteria bacterium]
MRFPVAAVITRLILGGAQETVILSAEGVGGREGNYPTDVFAGPEAGSEGSIWEDAVVRGVRTEIVPSLVRQIDPIRDLAAFSWLVRRLRQGARVPGESADLRFAYEVVHTHSSKAGVLGRRAARKLEGVAIVHTVHGWPFHDAQPAWLQSFYRALERREAAHTDRLICVSERDVQKGLAAGIGRAEQYRVVRSGIELDRFHPDPIARREVREEWAIPQDAVLIGAVTRLSPQKAPLELVQILLGALRDQPSTWGLIVGDGPDRPEVEDAVRSEEAGRRIVLTGLRHDAHRYFAALDAFVLPSRWEGLPRTLPQAMATGVPIVCSAVDGNAEAVRDGTEGFVFPVGDVERAANRVRELVGSEVLRRRFGEAGRFRAREFSAERMLKDLHQVYDELVFGGPLPGRRPRAGAR